VLGTRGHEDPHDCLRSCSLQEADRGQGRRRAMDRVVRAWLVRPAKLDAADLVKIIGGCTNENLTEAVIK
jgi:hypothetical protein